MASGDERAMTWAALLGKWTEFAQSAVALPREDEGGRLREAVASIIALQAVTHALGELADLEADERALGLDRAEMQIRKHAGEVNRIWRGEEMPRAIVELVEDAFAALDGVSGGGVEWVVSSERLVAAHPGDLALALIGAGFEGDLYLPTPGVPLFEGAPAGFMRGADLGSEVGGMAMAEVAIFLCRGGEVTGQESPVARQVYRQFDFAKGGPVRDVVRSMEAALTPGQPLLVPVILAGEFQPVTLPIPGADRQGALPVVFEEEDADD